MENQSSKPIEPVYCVYSVFPVETFYYSLSVSYVFMTEYEIFILIST